VQRGTEEVVDDEEDAAAEVEAEDDSADDDRTKAGTGEMDAGIVVENVLMGLGCVGGVSPLVKTPPPTMAMLRKR